MASIIENQFEAYSDLYSNLHQYSMGLGVVKNSGHSAAMHSGFGKIKPREAGNEQEAPAEV